MTFPAKSSVDSPADFLTRLGLRPVSWEEALQAIEQRLTNQDLSLFQKLHRAFAAYPAEHTCRAFYDFAARNRLLDLLASFRFDRLRRVAESLAGLPLEGTRVLDFGAGGGFLARWLRDARRADVSALDLSPAALEALQTAGMAIFPDVAATQAAEARFDFILCADSLGEIHADDDDGLAQLEGGDPEAHWNELEARYGFSEKLEALKPLLQPGGSVLVFEPVSSGVFWRALAAGLARSGWRTRLAGPEPAWRLEVGLG